jgi:hypothetical protein
MTKSNYWESSIQKCNAGSPGASAIDPTHPNRVSKPIRLQENYPGKKRVRRKNDAIHIKLTDHLAIKMGKG